MKVRVRYYSENNSEFWVKEKNKKKWDFWNAMAKYNSGFVKILKVVEK